MGYEAVYKYHERTDDGYNKEEVKTFKKKVGDPFEEIPLEKLAGAVMAQLARRDIWIVDVELFELSKKSISFKETKGGIVLKNKKFLFDGGGEDSSAVVVHEFVTAQPVAVQPSTNGNHVNIQAQGEPSPNPSGAAYPHNQGPRRPIDWVIFQPELHMMPEIKQKNLRLTPDKKYPVFQKKDGPLGEIYTMSDDTGRELLVSDKYFVPGNVRLLADRELGFSESQQQRDGGKLYWGGANNEPDMPNIRR